MIASDGWAKYNIWQHSKALTELYTRRAQGQEEEMTCAAQAAQLIAELIEPGDILLDAGCGSGYFYHSLRARKIPTIYCGIDATEDFINIGRRELKPFGLQSEQLQTMRIEDLYASVDHVLCMNVLSNIDNYHRPLERLLLSARKTLILRESIKDGAEYNFVHDRFLDEGVNLNVHVNCYDRTDMMCFIKSYGFNVKEICDLHSGGKPQDVIGYPHYWTFLLARRVF